MFRSTPIHTPLKYTSPFKKTKLIVGLSYLGLHCAISSTTTINIKRLSNHHASVKDKCKYAALPLPYERLQKK